LETKQQQKKHYTLAQNHDAAESGVLCITPHSISRDSQEKGDPEKGREGPPRAILRDSEKQDSSVCKDKKRLKGCAWQQYNLKWLQEEKIQISNQC
jgi:hypothetical protein